MKRIFSLILFCILSLGAVQTHANDDISLNDKQTLPVLIINNSYSDTKPSFSKLKSELPSILINQITKSLEAKYNVKPIDNIFNIHDVASTEKDDILDMFKEPTYSTVILVEILPVQFGYNHDDFYSIHVKILDITNKKYLYNGKLWREKGMPRSALEDMNIEIDKILKNVFNL